MELELNQKQCSTDMHSIMASIIATLIFYNSGRIILKTSSMNKTILFVINNNSKNIIYDGKLYKGLSGIYNLADEIENDLLEEINNGKSVEFEYKYIVDKVDDCNSSEYNFSVGKKQCADNINKIFTKENAWRILKYKNLHNDFISFVCDDTKQNMIITYSVKNPHLEEYLIIALCISKISIYQGDTLCFTLFRPDLKPHLIMSNKVMSDDDANNIVKFFNDTNKYMKNFCRKVSDEKYTIYRYF
mgnify:CR=1 FL=1